jgi:hypothetical protein
MTSDPVTDTARSAAWYDAFETGETDGVTSYSIPRATSCAEMEMGNAGTLWADVQASWVTRECAGFEPALGLGDGNAVFFAFTSCSSFDLRASKGLNGVIVRSGSSSHVFRAAFGAGIDKVAVETQIDAIEICHTMSAPPPPAPPPAPPPPGDDGTSSSGGSSGKTW